MLDFSHLDRWRFALRNLILKDFRVRYRNMALGLLWSVFNPLVMLCVITFIFTYVYPAHGRRIFPVFVLTGLVSFNVFSRTLSAVTGSIVDNALLVKRVAFPRILIPLSIVCSQVIDGVVMFALLLVFVLLFSVPVTASFFWLPLVFAVEVVFLLGVALLASAMNVYYRDVRYLVESGLTVLFWLSPVFYPVSAVRGSVPALLYRVYMFNPLVGCIEGARNAILLQRPPGAETFGVAAAVAVATLAAGLAVFTVLQKQFADRM